MHFIQTKYMVTRKKSISLNAILLGMSLIFTKIIGAFYRIPLFNILGSEGIGIYQMVYSIYAFLIMLISGAYPMAISRMVSERRAEEDAVGTLQVFNCARKQLSIASLLIALILIALAKPIATLQGNSSISTLYYAIAPSIPFVAILSCYRGWYQGIVRFEPTALSQISEQAIKLVAGLLLSYYLIPYGAVYGALGAALAVSISELISLLVIKIVYKKTAPITIKNTPIFSIEGKNLLSIAGPVTLASIIIPLIGVIDSFLVVNLLRFNGLGVDISTSYYGLWTGVIQSLVNVPVIISMSLAVVSVPVISAFKAKRDYSAIVAKAGLSIKLTYTIGVFMAFIYYLAAKLILLVLYPSLNVDEFNLSVKMMQISGLSIIFICQLQIYNSLCQTIGDVKSPIKNMLVVAVIRLGLTILLVIKAGIIGLALAAALSYLLAAVLARMSYTKLTGKSGSMIEKEALIIASGLISFLITVFIGQLVADVLVRSIFYIIVGGALYFIALILFRIYDAEELAGIPIVKRVVRRAVKSVNFVDENSDIGEMTDVYDASKVEQNKINNKNCNVDVSENYGGEGEKDNLEKTKHTTNISIQDNRITKKGDSDDNTLDKNDDNNDKSEINL